MWEGNETLIKLEGKYDIFSSSIYLLSDQTDYPIDTTVHSLRKWLAPNAVWNLWWLQFYNLHNVRVQMHNKSWVNSIVWPKNLNF